MRYVSKDLNSVFSEYNVIYRIIKLLNINLLRPIIFFLHPFNS